MQEKESKTNSHFWQSIIKSGCRIIACYMLYHGDLRSTATFFAIAEVFGITEEL